VFVKQLGSVPVMDEQVWGERFGGQLLKASNRFRAPAGTVPIFIRDAKGGKIDEWHTDLRVREYPEVRV
jgi:hypothetical protein